MQNDNDTVELFTAIREEGDKVDHYMRADLERLVPEIDGLLREVLEYGLFNGGKRIRPLLVVLASRLCGGSDEGMYQLGCAFEYLHAATLFHDDIIDNSATRRGKPSIFKKFGNTSAILAGDFLLALSMERIGQFAGQPGLRIFCQAAAGMVDGEFMQLRNAEKHNLSAIDYHNVIMGKTALLIAAACEIGAIHGGGNPFQQDQLKNYGMHLGCAFQIIDDVLDYLGDPLKTGKALGADLLEGKMTLPLIIALRDGTEEDKSRLLEIIGNTEKRSERILEVVELIQRNNGFQVARDVAEDAVRRAKETLQLFDSAEVRRERQVLHGLATYVIERDK